MFTDLIFFFQKLKFMSKQIDWKEGKEEEEYKNMVDNKASRRDPIKKH